MSWVELIITFGISVGAVVWGFNIYHQRGTWFLAGWNTMQKETKATYNVQALCQLYGKCVMGCGLGLFLVGMKYGDPRCWWGSASLWRWLFSPSCFRFSTPNDTANKKIAASN